MIFSFNNCYIYYVILYSVQAKIIKFFNSAFIVLDKIEDELIPIKETLEKKHSSIQKRIDNYEMKNSLTERQEELIETLQFEADELEDIIENMTEFLDHISDALSLNNFDLDFIKNRSLKLTKQLEKLKAKSCLY